jgi:glycine/D-amino acid oxidase-like deaminating enzyme
MTASLWLDEPYAPRAALTHESVASVAVLGGGITGVATSYWLSQFGKPSVLLERQVVAAGATGRNAGFLLEGTAPAYDALVERHGRATAGALWRFTAENRDRLIAACERESLGCEVTRCGSVVAASSVGEFEGLRRQAALLTEDGFRCEVWERAQMLDRLNGVGGFVGGMYNERDAGLNPVRFVRALAGVSEQRSVQIFEGSPVRSLEREGRHWRVATPSGSVRAESVVLGLNAYTAMVDPSWQGLVDPVRGQVLATAPVGREMFANLFYANHGFEYWRQLPDGRVVLGGLRQLAMADEVGMLDTLHPRIQDALTRYLRDLGVPPYVQVTHRWSGVMGFVRDRLPLIGPVPDRPGLYIAGGYSGHGLAFAFLAGRMIAQLIVEGDTEYPRVLFPERLMA